VSAVLALILGSATSPLAQGRIGNARMETRTVAQTLDREVQAVAARGGSAWVGYRIPMIPGERHMCCIDVRSSTNDCCGMCRLESGGGVTARASARLATGGSPVVVESPTDLIILARVENREVTRIRTFTPDCDIDAGDMPIVWLERVSPADSVGWLGTLLKGTGMAREETRLGRPAMSALGLHSGEEALRALLSLAREDVRDPIRGQALFWLAQRDNHEATVAIENAVENDGAADVRIQAVFALSTLPRGEGIPRLIQAARSSSRPEVRRQAMFWLGRSKDARAAAFFEDVLRKP
jgi:hypothetical protein